MKKLLLFGLIIFQTFSSYSQINTDKISFELRYPIQTMYVKVNMGIQTAYSFENISKISFTEGTMMINQITENPNIYELSEIRYLNFTDLSLGFPMPNASRETTQLYPNPVFDLMNIQFSIAEPQVYLIELISVEGNVVYKEKKKGENKIYQINVSTLHKGLYICKISNGITTEIMKFIKQ